MMKAGRVAGCHQRHFVPLWLVGGVVTEPSTRTVDRLSGPVVSIVNFSTSATVQQVLQAAQFHHQRSKVDFTIIDLAGRCGV